MFTCTFFYYFTLISEYTDLYSIWNPNSYNYVIIIHICMRLKFEPLFLLLPPSM